jgi:uncharacterized protein with HEPN domain
MKDRLGDKVRLLHIQEAILEIESYIEQTSFTQFNTNSMLRSACIRQLEVIGEATSRLSDDMILQNPVVEWQKIKALRNLLIHEYFGVSNQIVWNVIQHNIPILKIQIDSILADNNK